MSDAVVKSAARVLEVFEYFAKRRSPASVREVCLALGYPQSSTSVLLRSLRTLGSVAYDAMTRQYSPTTRVAMLGNWIEEGPGSLTTLLDDVRARTGETVLLAEQNGLFVQFSQVLEAADGGRLAIAASARYPLVRNAAGRVLLAEMSDAQILRIVRRYNVQVGRADERVEEGELIEAVAQVRRTGFAQSEQGFAPGFAMIATFAPQMPSQAALAVAVAAPVDRLRRGRESIVAALRRLAPAQGAPRTPRDPGAAGTLYTPATAVPPIDGRG
jgi:DNA-binding IclR family transcriptional regulator